MDLAALPKLDFHRCPAKFPHIMNSITNLTAKQLRQAANIQDKIAALQKELQQILGGGEIPSPFARKTKRKMSKSARAKIAAGARARWAKIKGKTSAKPARKAKRKMSAANKARLSAMAKARWKKAKAAGKRAL